MSGRKYSQVELADSLREAIHCRNMAECALDRAANLVAVLADAVLLAESLRPISLEAQQALEAAREELGGLKPKLVESRLATVTLDEVRGYRQRVNRVAADLERVSAKCQEGKHAAGTRFAAQSFVNEIVQARATVEPYTGSTYGEFLSEARNLLEETDRSMSTTGSARAVVERIAQATVTYRSIIQRAESRRGQDAERSYIAEALRNVCEQDLGFAARVLPRESPLHDLVVEVDTFAFGLIHFRLELDGTIRSQSEMREIACPANFKLIERKLRELGVVTGFRYESDQSPVSLSGSAKAQPAEIGRSGKGGAAL